MTAPPDTTPLAMRGLKVLDLSMGVAGPHAGMLCAQHGADVVKVETHEGDWARVLGRQYGDLSAFSLIYNRGKRSLAIDLKQPDARAALQRMAAQADVIIEAFRPGVMKKFGLDHETVSQANPKVVYLSVTGFGAQGPLAGAPATDAVLQAFSGLMFSNQDERGTPQRIDLVLIDVITGLYGFQAISAALLALARGEATRGRHIDCSLMKSALAFQAGKIVENYIEEGDRAMYVPLGVFATSDGHVSLSVRRDDHFATFCHAIGCAELLEGGTYATGEQRVARQAELLPLLKAALRRFSTDALCRRLTEASILHAPINTYKEVLAHPQVQEMDAVLWQSQEGMALDGGDRKLPIAAIPGAPNAPELSQAPRIGQHSLQALEDWGIEADAIARMSAAGALRPA
jgi:crotonobetainyl-CoA:carnitine CoA-transferase CaiB-like acyl-CoA transferase